MPHNALEWHVFVQMNVTRIWFAGYINDGTAAGIYALRRLKFKRCGELALRLSSRLTFAWGCVAGRAIHPGRSDQRGRSCNSPDRQYATTDMCGNTPAVR